MIKVQWTPDLDGVYIKKDRSVLKAWYGSIAEDAYQGFAKEHRQPGRGAFYAGRRASAPGDTPAKDSGTLLRGTKRGANTKEGFVGTNVFYARFLRDGTKKMAARKMFYPQMVRATGDVGVSGLSTYLQWSSR